MNKIRTLQRPHTPITKNPKLNRDDNAWTSLLLYARRLESKLVTVIVIISGCVEEWDADGGIGDKEGTC